MRHLHTLQLPRISVLVTNSLVILLCLAFANGQTAGNDEAAAPFAQNMNKYPGLFPAFGRLIEKIQHDVSFPSPRRESRLLPLLPESTVFYAAIPNYGDASHRALAIFQQELKQSAVLHDWWYGEVAKGEPGPEPYLEQFYQFSQYLGDEIVVSGSTDGAPDPRLLILAELRKPGLKEFLQRSIKGLPLKDLSGSTGSPVRVLDVRELATAKDTAGQHNLVLLVRSDFVIAALDVPTLRAFNTQLDRKTRQFASTPFGQRLAHAYDDSVTVLGAADLQSILKQIGPLPQNQQVLQRTGFADSKYAIWDHTTVAGQSISQMELSFVGPRHGVASWLAAPGPMGSLEFASPKAILVVTTLLKDPAQIFDDVRDLSTASNPNGFAAVEQTERGLNLDLKRDLFSLLGGEITLEMDRLTPPNPAWRIILKVKDASHLQATLNTLFAQAPVKPQQYQRDGQTYYALHIPSGQRTQEIAYAFTDGYLVVASSQDSVEEAIRMRHDGNSLAESAQFLAAIPPGPLSQMSALLYEDPVAIAALSMQRASPEMAEMFSQQTTATSPVLISAYGEENAIREVSRNPGFDAGATLVVAAIAIPNLLRARIAANEASAASNIRTANTAQVSYAASYPERGFARSLSALGSGPLGGNPSPDHAMMIDSTLGNENCTAGAWCEKSGFRFSMTAVCKIKVKTKTKTCEDYVIVATPVSSSTGLNNFCSTSDANLHAISGPPLTTPISVAECQSWPMLQESNLSLAK